jgi:hypothetical protein
VGRPVKLWEMKADGSDAHQLVDAGARDGGATF